MGQHNPASDSRTKAVFVVNTPAQAHQFRPVVRSLSEQGHEPLILARDYGCTVDLLEYHGLPYEVYGSVGMEQSSLYRTIPVHYYQIFKRVRQFDPDVVFGRSVFAAHAGLLTRTPSVLVVDSEVTSIDHRLSQPVADYILTPHTFEKDLGNRHFSFEGFTECAYLHPEVWERQTDIRSELGLDPDERYAVLRFNCLRAHHDVGESGFTIEQRNRLIEALSEAVTVLVSDEAAEGGASSTSARAFDIHPALMHDALAEADLLVADTQTMVTEAALLGTPAIRSNSFVGESDMGNFVELEEAGLIRNHERFRDVLDSSRELLGDESVQETWTTRAEEYMSDKVNLRDLLVDVVASFDSIERFERLDRQQPVVQ